MSHTSHRFYSSPRIFGDAPGSARRIVVLPWRRAFSMCAANVRHRRGRSLITFVCIAVVVAFFASSMTNQHILGALRASADVRVQAALERANAAAPDPASAARQDDQQRWLLGLSALLCLAGITNTILMSVTERVREIGTLKCLGALDRFIVRLFLIENACLGAAASFSGALLGIVLAVLQTGLMTAFGLLGVGVCLRAAWYSGPRAAALGTLLTVLASIYPTIVAARMKPVDAMRVDV